MGANLGTDSSTRDRIVRLRAGIGRPQYCRSHGRSSNSCRYENCNDLWLQGENEHILITDSGP
jgi:hypothetical protein